jgi:hypothetical protein
MVLARLAAVFLIASTSIAAGEIAIRSAPGKDGPNFPTTTTDDIGRVRVLKAPASPGLTEPARTVPTDGATWGLVGGVVGTILGCLGGYLGARASYRSAVNEAQRRFYRRIFAWLAPLVILFLAVVWLAAAGILPYWVYIAVMIAWLAPLLPAVFWTNRRLAQLAAEPDPRITLKTSQGAFRRDPGN